MLFLRYHNEKPLSSIQRISYQPFMFDKNNQVLLLTEAHYSDEGVYKCVVKNRHGAIERESKFEWRGIKISL